MPLAFFESGDSRYRSSLEAGVKTNLLGAVGGGGKGYGDTGPVSGVLRLEYYGKRRRATGGCGASRLVVGSKALSRMMQQLAEALISGADHPDGLPVGGG